MAYITRSTCLRFAALAEKAAARVTSRPDRRQLQEIARFWRELAAQKGPDRSA